MSAAFTWHEDNFALLPEDKPAELADILAFLYSTAGAYADAMNVFFTSDDCEIDPFLEQLIMIYSKTRLGLNRVHDQFVKV